MGSKLKLIVAIGSLPLFLYFWPSFLGGDTEFMIVNGPSMLPTIQSGSLAIVKKTQSYDVGDIVAYKDSSSNRLVIHRIMVQKDDGFIIKGDNNKANDPGIIKQEAIRGEAIFVAPYMGYITNYLKNPVIMAVSILASMAAMFAKKEKKKKDTQYSFLSIAILINLLSYLLSQISITRGVIPKIDGYSNYLFTIFEPYFASTLVFATWFFVIIGLHLMVRYYEWNSAKHLENVGHKGILQIKKQDNVQLAAQAFYLLLIMIQTIYLLVALKGLMPN